MAVSTDSGPIYSSGVERKLDGSAEAPAPQTTLVGLKPLFRECGKPGPGAANGLVPLRPG